MKPMLMMLIASLLTLAQAQLTWTNYTTANGLGNNFLFDVYATDSTIYVATRDGGLSISTNDGTDWTTYTTADGLGDNRVISVYAVGSTIYAATRSGLSISTDNGANWTNYTNADGLGDLLVESVYAVGSTIYAATANGLSISTDDGANWTNYTNADGLGDNTVTSVYAVGSTIYVATFSGGLSISTNDGTDWTTYTTDDGLGDNIVQGVYAVGSTIYAATSNGLSISTDDGANWTIYTTVDGLGSLIVESVYAVGSTIYAATSNGLSISTDDGANWTNYTDPDLGSFGVFGVYAVGNTIYAATAGGLSVSPAVSSGSSVINPNPDIQIRNGDSTAADSITAGSVVNVGAFKRGEVATVDFLVRNPGAQVLELGELSLPSFLSVSGEPLPATLASFGSALLSLEVNTSAAGALEGAFSLVSNDPDEFENPFVFTITGSVSDTPANVLNILPGVDIGDVSTATGQEDVVLLSFKLVVPEGSTSVTVDSLTLAASNAGIGRASNLRLYIDGGTRGELDNRDVFVSATDDTEALTFSFSTRTFSPELPMWFIVVGDF